MSNILRIAQPYHGAAVLAAVALAAFTLGMAQSEPASTPEPVVAAPEPIGATELPRRADEVLARLKAILAGLPPADGLQRLIGDVPELLAEVSAEQQVFEQLDFAAARLFELDEMRWRWRRLRAQVRDAYTKLERQSAPLQAQRDELRDLRAAWQLTADAAPERELPGALRERVQVVLTEIDGVRAELDARTEELLVWQNQVSDAMRYVEDSLARIATARTDVRKQVFTLDHRPLWTELTRPDGDTVAEQLRATLREERAQIAQFATEYRSRLTGHAAVLALVVIGLFVLRRRASRIVVEDDDYAVALRLVSRPVMLALLLCLFPLFWLYRLAPVVVYQLNLLILLVPVLALLPLFLPSRLRAPLLGFSVVYVLLKVFELALDDSLLERLLLLLVSVAALVGAWWFLQPRGRAVASDGGVLWRVAIRLGRLGMVAMAVSIGANLVGAVALAILLTSGTLNSAYAAVLILGFGAALRGVVAVVLRTKLLSSLQAVRNNRDLIRDRGMRILRVLGVAFWIWVTLGIFRVRPEVMQGVRGALERRWQVGTLDVSLGDILAFALAVWISVQVSRFVRWIFADDVVPRLAMPRGVAGAMGNLLHYGIMAIGFLVAIAVAGIELGKLTIVIGALSVGIGFGLQNLVNNFVSGLILMFERPVNVGDTVEVGTTTGEVRRIGMRASVVRTAEGAEVIVPNGNLISAEVINWTLSDRLRRVELPVGVAYGSDPEQVMQILVDAARADGDVLDRPAPYALFKGFGESSLNFSLRFWTANFEWWMRVSSRVAVNVNAKLAEAGIEIPFPQRELRIKNEAPPPGTVT